MIELEKLHDEIAEIVVELDTEMWHLAGGFPVADIVDDAIPQVRRLEDLLRQLGIPESSWQRAHVAQYSEGTENPGDGAAEGLDPSKR